MNGEAIPDSLTVFHSIASRQGGLLQVLMRG